MKKNFILLALLLVGLSAGQNVFGQLGASSAGSFRKFDEMKDKARTLRTGKSYRVKTTTEVFADEKSTTPKGKSVATVEHLGIDRKYFSIVNEALGKTSKVEFIVIGEKEYIREDGKQWKKYTPKTEGRVSMSGIGNSNGGKLLEKTTLNGKNVTVYEEETNSYSDDYEENSVTRYWFDDGGELLKTEARNTDLKTKEVTKIITIYEYDPNIKIEAPIK